MKIGPEISDSIELKFSSLAQKMNAEGRQIVSFGLGEPDFPTPEQIVQAATQAMQNGHTRYSSPFGIAELRERIASKLTTENQLDAQPDNVIVTPGAKMALSLALGSLLQPGDELIILTPCYPSYIPQAKIAEPACKVQTLDLLQDGFAIDFDELKRLINPRTKAVLLNFPNNPTGRMLSAGDIESLAGLASEQDFWIISDEIYEKLNFSEARHHSPGGHLALAGRTITINGFSKAFSMTGWRIGYLHVPDRTLLGLMSKLQQHLNTNTATFIQHAACAAFSVSTDFLEAYNTRLNHNFQFLDNMVSQNERLRLSASQGGLFAFLDISGLEVSSDQFASQLLSETNVAATPGVVFGDNWDDHLRVSMAIEENHFADGVERLDGFVKGL